MFAKFEERKKLENKLRQNGIFEIISFYKISEGRDKKSAKKIYDEKIFEIKLHTELLMKWSNEIKFLDDNEDNIDSISKKLENVNLETNIETKFNTIIEEMKMLKDEIQNELRIINPIIEKLENIELNNYIDEIEIEQTFHDINKKYEEVKCEVRKLFKLEYQAILEKKFEEDSSSDDDY